MNINDILYFMDALPETSLLVDCHGNIIGCNNDASKHLKYTNNELKSLNIDDLVPEQLRQAHKVSRKAFVMSGGQRAVGSCDPRYYRTRCADNTEIMTEISIGRLRVDDSDEPVLLVILIDRTERCRLEEELVKRANIDKLTELYSRSYFLELVEKEMSRSFRYDNPLSLIYFDVDHFKAVNDTHGHHIGDLVLRQVGNTCKQVLRNIDICGRIGGEEFAIVLPETNLYMAVKVAQRVRLSFKNIRVPSRDGEISVSASFGVTKVLDTDVQVDDPIQRADKALYRAKKKGRDRIEVEDFTVTPKVVRSL